MHSAQVKADGLVAIVSSPCSDSYNPNEQMPAPEDVKPVVDDDGNPIPCDATLPTSTLLQEQDYGEEELLELAPMQPAERRRNARVIDVAVSASGDTVHL